MTDYPETYPVQFASVGLEFKSTQFNSKTKKHGWQLTANVTFNSVEIPGTAIGDIELFINKATLAIELQNCELNPMRLGYQRIMEQKRESAHKKTEKTTTEASGILTGEAKANMSLTRFKGDLAFQSKGKTSAKKQKSMIEQESWKEYQYLVTHSQTGTDNKSAEWRISAINEPLKLIGTVISEDDPNQGNLGEITSFIDGGFSATPKINIVPSAQVMDESRLKLSEKLKLARLNRAEKNKLGVIGALIKKKLIHKAFPKISLDEFK